MNLHRVRTRVRRHVSPISSGTLCASQNFGRYKIISGRRASILTLVDFDIGWKHTRLFAAGPRVNAVRATLKQAIGRVDVEPGQRIFSWLIRNRKDCRSLAQTAGTTPADAAARAADSDATAAAAAATTAATASAAAATAAAATATAAAAAPATPRHLLQGAAVVFLVEEVERRETDVGDFFLTERDGLRRREVEFLRDVSGGRGCCGGAPDQPKSQTGSAQRRHRGLGDTLPLRSLFHSWHRRILHTCAR
jgi:hypothetical protein